MASKRTFHCIAAMDVKRGIGKNGDLPWKLPKEFKYFTETTKRVSDPTKQNAVIMGKNTWLSIPPKFRPLSDRLNVLISTSLKSDNLPENVKLTSSFTDALQLLSSEPLLSQVENIFIVGGSSVYKEAMNSENCDRIYLTQVDGDFECDTFYPMFDETIYKEIKLNDVPAGIQSEKGINYTFHVYARFHHEE